MPGPSSKPEEQKLANYPTPPFDTPRQPIAGHDRRDVAGTGPRRADLSRIWPTDRQESDYYRRRQWYPGRAVAIAYAREGADVLIAYLDEDEDARETQKWVEEAGRKAILVSGTCSIPNIAATSSKQRAANLAVSTSSSTTRPIRQASRILAEISDDEWELDLQGQYPCDVLSDQGGGPACESGQRDHQYGVDQC